jgi:two-component system response regulator HydG
MPELVFFRRGDEVLRCNVDRPRFVLGRGERCDVVIPDPEVSRQQVALTQAEGRTYVEDLSGKGSMVGGARITDRTLLQDGADIALGQWRALFHEKVAGGTEHATEARGTQTEGQPKEATSQRWQAAQVRIRQGPNETLHTLSGDSFTVGKDEGNDLVLDDKFISGKHVKVTRKGGLFQVVDSRSTNGTYVGPIRIYEADVPLLTTLKVGGVELVLEPVSSSKKEADFHGIIGTDPSVRQLIDLIERVAPSNAAVAILGESGTGKELVAHALHARSTRRDKAFIPVNCAAISKELIESELFGHEKGSFTGATNARAGAFEEADGGTLFLDEIGELPIDLQAKLLRALESGEIKRVGASRPLHVDVRIVAATNQNLLAAARAGRFREDLYYRLCVIPLHLPPLRSRRGDVLALAEHFVRAFSPRGQTLRLTSAAFERLQAHVWPGNIRELRNVIHRALLLRKGPMIDAPDLTFDQELSVDTSGALGEVPGGTTLEQILDRVTRQVVEAALKRYNNNRERVAQELGLSRSTLFKRLKEWGMTSKAEEEPAGG